MGFFNFNWSTAIASFTAGGSTSTPDFNLSASPNPLTVPRGSNRSTTVTVTAVNGSSTVNLSVIGLPPRTSASFSPTAVPATGTSTLKITVNRNASVGTYPLTINGSNGSTSHGTSLSLIVQ